MVHKIVAMLLQLGWTNSKYKHQAESKENIRSDLEPTHTTWISCANQTNDFTCGYHAIFNGWAVALGLELNPRFYSKWEPRFTDSAQGMLCIAMLGKASSELIHNFLDCIGFVIPNQTIDRTRMFHHTFKTNIEDDLDRSLEEIRAEEQRNWNGLTDAMVQERLAKISRTNRVRFTGSSRHHDATWLNDEWNEFYLIYIKDAANACQKRIDLMELDNDQLTYALKTYSTAFQSEAYDEETFRQILLKIQRNANRTHLFTALTPEFIERNPSRVAKEHYKYLTSVLRQIGSPKVHVSDSVILSIAAVVQAIDRKQAELARRNEPTFSGGFAIDTQIHIQAAAMGSKSTQMARPRRCWLMPFEFVSGDWKTVRSHDFLVVLQEEKKDSSDDTQFCVYFLDSIPDLYERLGRSRLEMFEQVKTTAENTGWATHRNEDGYVKFCSKPKYVKVTRQNRGTDPRACSFHVILNAWILALGLTPKVNDENGSSGTRGFVPSLRVLLTIANSGYLDWKTLVAWLFAQDLTVEKTVSSVPLDRRFDATVAQSTQERLQQDIDDETIEVDDATLLSCTESEKPYNHENNVNFARGSWSIEEPADEEEEEDSDGPQQLDRLDEDMDDLGYPDFRSDLQYYHELVEREWEERKYQERCARRSRWLQKMRNQRRPSGIRRRELSF